MRKHHLVPGLKYIILIISTKICVMFGVNHPFPDACKIIQIWLYVTVQPTLYHQKRNITLKKPKWLWDSTTKNQFNQPTDKIGIYDSLIFLCLESQKNLYISTGPRSHLKTSPQEGSASGFLGSELPTSVTGSTWDPGTLRKFQNSMGTMG
jgi:hypothetical protein